MSLYFIKTKLYVSVIMKMKKISLPLLCLLFAICASLCSCSRQSYGNTPTSPYYKDPSAESESAEETVPSFPVSIDRQTVYDKDGIKVTVTEILNDSFWGPEIKLEIENGTDKNIELECADSSVNGIMQELLFYAKADAGQNVSDSITVYRDDLLLSKTYGIQKIEFRLTINNKDDGTSIDRSDMICLTPKGAEEFSQVYDDSGECMLDVDGVKIIAKKIKNTQSVSGAKIYLYIENKSGMSLALKCSGVSVNNTALDAYFSCRVLNGKVAISELSILESDFKKHSITDISKLDVTLVFTDTDTNEEFLTLPVSAELKTFAG